jgi:hypothetical protein
MTGRSASLKIVGELKQESGEAVWWKPIPDQFSTIDEVTWALRDHGLESSNLIIGIDFTKVWLGCVVGVCVDAFSTLVTLLILNDSETALPSRGSHSADLFRAMSGRERTPSTVPICIR